MPYRDFREFLDVLRNHGELVDIDRPVALNDVGKALKQSYVRQGPALQFNHNGTDFPLVGGVYSTRSKALLAFEAMEETIFDKVVTGLGKRIPPNVIEGQAPCQEQVITGDQIDIRRFPIPVYSPMDGGAYITPGIVVSRDPETGVPDIGHYRFMVLDGKLMSFVAEYNHRFGKNLAKHKRLGKRAEGALVIGVDPVLAYTGQAQVSDDTDDWQVAGGLRGAPVELVKCRTVDLDVPATAEVVIEFEVDQDNLYPEGPLGEHTGYYDATGKDQPAAQITAITHRRKPIFQALLTGKPVTENHILKQIPFEASFYSAMKRQFPTVERVALRASSSVSYYVVIAMRPRFAGEARQAIFAAMASALKPKWVIVVDPDVDITDPTEVEWAMSFRVQPTKDVVIVDGMPRGGCDPSVPVPDGVPPSHLSGSSVGIDATYPVGQAWPDVADVPGWESFSLPELDSLKR
jgi:4-hydroxy-3-polyprenylbenzoate decarboxylase/2,5-furandicarboxylate decarboxylase 1